MCPAETHVSQPLLQPGVVMWLNFGHGEMKVGFLVKFFKGHGLMPHIPILLLPLSPLSYLEYSFDGWSCSRNSVTLKGSWGWKPVLRMAKQKEKEVRTLMTLWGHHSDPGLPTSGLIWHDRQDIFVSKSLLFGCFITSSQTQFLPGEVGGWCFCVLEGITQNKRMGGGLEFFIALKSLVNIKRWASQLWETHLDSHDRRPYYCPDGCLHKFTSASWACSPAHLLN